MIFAKLNETQKLKCIIDTGSTRSLIANKVVEANTTLSKLQKFQIDPFELYVGNGDMIVANYVIYIPLQLGTYFFHIPFLVANSMSTHVSIIGSDVLEQINAQIFVAEQKMKFNVEQVQFASEKDYIIQPGEQKVITVEPIDKNKKIDGCILPIVESKNEQLVTFNKNKAQIKIFNANLKPKIISVGEKVAQIKDNTVLIEMTYTITSNVSDCIITDELVRDFDYESLDLSDMKNKLLLDNEVKTCLKDDVMVLQPVKQLELNNKGKSICEMQNKLDKLTTQEQQLFKEKSKKYPWLVDAGDKRLFLKNEQIIDQYLRLDNTILNSEQVKEITQLVKKYEDCFALHNEVGRMKTEVNIPFIPHEPFSFRPFSVPIKYQSMLEAEVHRLLQLGILGEADMKVRDISPGFPVLKADGKNIRLITDLRHLNNFVPRDPYPMLHFDLLLRHLGDRNLRYITCLDISTAYFSVRLDPVSQTHLGVSIGDKIYYLKGLPQGLKISAQLYTKILSNVLKRLPFWYKNLYSYIDDLILATETWEQHKNMLEQLFQVLAEEGIKLSLEKSKFCSKEVSILGNVFLCKSDKIQITAKRSRTEAIGKIAIPKNRKLLRQFLGAANFLARFLPDYRRMASVLYQLTGSKVKFNFTEVHIKAFEEIKKLITSPKVIYLPSPKGKKVLYTDSSEIGSGAILYDVITTENGSEEWFVLGYDSCSYGKKKFTSSTHHELYALIHAILNFKYLLYGNQFVVISDSLALVKLAKGYRNLQLKGVFLRLFEKLAGFNFVIEHEKAGSSEGIRISDILSRLPIDEDRRDDPHVIIPYTYPLAEYLPKDNEEIVLTNYNTEENEPRYNLRRNRKSPTRYGVAVKENELDNALNEEISEPEINETDQEHTESSEITSHENIQELDELFPVEDLDKIDIPEFMIQPERQLFENPNKDQIIIKHYPKQIDMNAFLNDIMSVNSFYERQPLQKHELIAAQRDSVGYRDIYNYLKWNTLPSSRKHSSITMQNSQNFCLIQDILCHISYDKSTSKYRVRVVIPNEELGLHVIHYFHTSKLINHMATSSLYNIINAKYYIRNAFDLVRKYVSSCYECAMSKAPEEAGALYDFKFEPRNIKSPFDCVHIDLKKLYKSQSGMEYILVLVDVKTSYLIAVAIPNRTTKVLISSLLSIIGNFGVFRAVYTDQESGLKSKLFQSIMKYLKIDISYAMSLGHQDSLAESAIRRISQRLQFLLSKHELYWDQVLPLAVFSANCIKRKSGFSPYELMFGREPVDIKVVDNPELDFSLPSSEMEYLQNLKAQFKTAFEIQQNVDFVEKTREQAKHRSKTKKIIGLQPFDFVYVLLPHGYLQSPNQKLTWYYSGPLIIKSQGTRSRSYILLTLCGQEVPIPVHLNRLKRANILVNGKVLTDLVSLIAEMKKLSSEKAKEILSKLQLAEQKILACMNKTEQFKNGLKSREVLEGEAIEGCHLYIDPVEYHDSMLKRFSWKNGELYALFQFADKNSLWVHCTENEDILNCAKGAILGNSTNRVVGSFQKYKKRLNMY